MGDTVDHELGGRVMSRAVLAELAGVWCRLWDEAIAMRERNPDMHRLALERTSDPELAIIELQPWLAQLHPQVAASVAEFCRAVRDEFTFDVDDVLVTPSCEHTFVGERGEIGGGQRQHDRLAKLENENEELRQKVRRLEAAMTMARAAIERAAEEPTA